MNKTEQKIFYRLMNAMRYREAIAYCRGLLPDTDARRNLALAYDQVAVVARASGKGYARLAVLAEKIITQAVASDKSPETAHVQGIILLHADRYEDALRAFRTAYRMKRHPGYLVSIANALRRLGKRRLALRHYRQAKAAGTLNTLMLTYNIVQTLQELGEVQAARAEANLGLRITPRNRFEKEVREQLHRIHEGLSPTPVGDDRLGK